MFFSEINIFHSFSTIIVHEKQDCDSTLKIPKWKRCCFPVAMVLSLGLLWTVLSFQWMMKMKLGRCCFATAMVLSLGYTVDCVVISVDDKNEAEKVLFCYGYGAVIGVYCGLCCRFS